MKRLFAFVLFAALLLCLPAGCSPAPETPDAPLRVGGMTGPTSMGMVRIMEDCDAGASAVDCTFTVAASADVLTPAFMQGELDVIAVPVNLASILYHRLEGDVRLLAVNSLGVLYVVDKNAPVASFADLKGRTVYATGKGSTPEYSLRHLLRQNGLDPDRDVTLEFKSEPAEIVSLLASAESAVAMLPQPYVTAAKGQVPELSVDLSLADEWAAKDPGAEMITGVLICRGTFAEAHPEQIRAFIDAYEESAAYVNAHVEEAASLIDKFGIAKEAVARAALPDCNVVCLRGEEMAEPVRAYLSVLMEADPVCVGGSLPGDDFYYE